MLVLAIVIFLPNRIITSICVVVVVLFVLLWCGI